MKAEIKELTVAIGVTIVVAGGVLTLTLAMLAAMASKAG